MFNTIITFAVLNSFFSPSILYYNKIAPVNSNLNTVQSSVERCKSFTSSEHYTTSYKLSSLGNQLYKVSTSDAATPVLKFTHNSESGAQVQSTPTVYLNARSEAKLIIGGLPESSYLAAHYKCHSKDLKNSSLYNYKFDFQNLGSLKLSPANYSYQKDVTTDTCQNLIESTPELGEEIVLNKWVLSQNYCYSIDESNLMLNLAVMPELTLPTPTAPALTIPGLATPRFLKPANTENTYGLKITQLRTDAAAQMKLIMSDASLQKNAFMMNAVSLTIDASNNEKTAAQNINLKMNEIKTAMNQKIASLTAVPMVGEPLESQSKIDDSWKSSTDEINMLLKDEKNQLQILTDQMQIAKEQEKNSINLLWIEEKMGEHMIDAVAYEKVIAVSDKMNTQISEVKAAWKAHDAKVAAAELAAQEKAAAAAAEKVAEAKAAAEKVAEAKAAAEKVAEAKAAAVAKPVTPAPETPAVAKPVTPAAETPVVASTESTKPAPLEG